uniref:Uncharacterized protein n=1 Tax=Macrostomum lignano TaxID=282301 RepID=A0A1I8I122_9PLAT
MNVDQFLLNRIRVAEAAAAGGATAAAVAEERRRQLPYWRCDVATLAERSRAPVGLWDWPDYLAVILVGTGLCSAGVIVELSDLRLLASLGVEPEPAKWELEELLSGIRRRGFRRKPITLCGRDWRVDLADGHTGIKCSGGELGRPEGFTAARSRSKLIIGWHRAEQDAALCNLAVCNLADFFSEKDF